MISQRSEIVPVAAQGLARALLWLPCPAITTVNPLSISAPVSHREQLTEQEVGGMLESFSTGGCTWQGWSWIWTSEAHSCS